MRRGRGHHATGGSTLRRPTPEGTPRRNKGGHGSENEQGHGVSILPFFKDQQPLGEIVDTKGDTRRITLFAGMRIMLTRIQDKTRSVVNAAFGVVHDNTKVIDKAFTWTTVVS